jgi:hypothetical protein
VRILIDAEKMKEQKPVMEALQAVAQKFQVIL